MTMGDGLWIAYGLLALVMLLLILHAPDDKAKQGDKKESDEGSN